MGQDKNQKQDPTSPRTDEQAVDSMDHIEATRELAVAYHDAARRHLDIAAAFGDAVPAARRLGELLGETDATGIRPFTADALDGRSWHHAEISLRFSQEAEALMENVLVRQALLMFREDGWSESSAG